MLKKTLYPKTGRMNNTEVIITEKLDGSNLGIFKLNGELIIAQRNYVFKESELTKKNTYKGLMGWIKDNDIYLCEGSGVFGEWIGMGKLKYGNSLDKRLYIFAKANIDNDYNIKNLNYNRGLFIYPFENQIIPSCIGVVPKVNYNGYINIKNLDIIYDEYKTKVGRDVEGFIINNSNTITKYVRHKNGKLIEHTF